MRPDVAELTEAAYWANTRIVLDTVTAEVSDTNRDHAVNSDWRKSNRGNVSVLMIDI